MGTWMCPRCDKPTLHSWSSSDGSEGCSCSNCGYIEQSGW
jgi:Zn ribbon nucleic-acid-binding protein